MKEDIKNLQEIINLCKEEINNNDKNITATLDLEDLKSLKNVLDSYKQLEEENAENNERLQIEFSKNGEGSILMTAVRNSLYLDKATTDNLKIGDKVAMNNEGFEPLAQLNFYKVETVDIFMEKLIAIRNNILLLSAS